MQSRMPHSVQDHSIPMSGYDVADLRIPYGPRWTADKVERLVSLVDSRMNCIYHITKLFVLPPLTFYFHVQLLLTSRTTWASITILLLLAASKSVWSVNAK